MALISVEFVGHHRIGGRLVQRWDASGIDAAKVRLTDRGLVVEEEETTRTIPWHAIHAVIETRAQPPKQEPPKQEKPTK
jgi:hypothetical protein